MKNELTTFFGFEEETSSVGAIIGPLFLLFAVILVLKAPTSFNYDLLFVAIFGLFLTAKWKIRGCIAALLLLAFSAGAKHVLFPEHHAWQAGLESSIGIALFISALIFEESSKWALAKQSELERNEKTILFLEEDLSQQKEEAAKESAAALEKLANLRLQLEELESQISTLQVLNDVLRKTTAKSIEEKEEAIAEVRTFDRREGLLLEEIDSLQTELNRLGNDSALAQQNKQLFEELNESRGREAQTHLINETLVRLHAKENQKVRELEAKFFAMSEQTETVSEDKERFVEQLQLQVQQTRLEQYRQVELLYRQLKGQFEEKNAILHQTRSELFLADTELQTIAQKLREKELAFNPVSQEICLELDAMEEENLALQHENRELQDLVSHLMQQDEASSLVKKKMKKSQPASLEQATLF
ncbi:MAG TPA: hypothetical protein VHL30_01170 [Chlamydiales bacterium]|jgi:hypothetical protein|nr:hypothetical protein [Chlamydiales bacterium]